MKILEKLKQFQNLEYVDDVKEVLTLKEYVGISILVTGPIFLVLLFVSIWVKIRVVNLDEQTMEFLSSPRIDIHSVARVEMLLILSILGLGLLIVSLIYDFKSKINLNKIWKSYLGCITVYVLFVVLSTIFSDNIQVAIWGLCDNGEGMVSQICYAVLFIIAMYSVLLINKYQVIINNHKYSGKWSMYLYLVLPLIIVLGINCGIGWLQYNEIDPFEFELIGRFVAGNLYQSYTFDTSAIEVGRVYGIMFQPNYAGAYGVLMCPFFFFLIFTTRKVLLKILFAICAILALVFTISTDSDGAIVGLVVASAIGILLYWKQLKKYWKKALLMAITFIIIVASVNVLFDGQVTQSLNTIAVEMRSMLTEEYVQEEYIVIYDIVIEENQVYIETELETLCLYIEDESVLVEKEGVIIATQELSNSEVWMPEESVDIKFTNTVVSEEKFLFYIRSGAFELNIRGNEEGFVSMLSPYNGLDIEMEYPQVALENIDPKLGTFRVYNWSRSIPLISEHLLLGCGPDNFVFEFPQYDLLGKAESDISMSMIFTKAHNLYLQFMINYGMVASVAFFAIVLLYGIDSWFIYRKGFREKFLGFFGCGIFVSIMGYMSTAFFTDMLIYYAPIFWILLGTGIALNFENRKVNITELQ